MKAIHEQDTPYRFEIIVIDSGSTDNTPDTVKTFESVRLLEIKPEDFGHGSTRNLGAETAKGDYIVFLNADAVPVDQNWLNPLIDALKEDRGVGGVFSRHIPHEDCNLYMARDLLRAMPGKRMVRSTARKMDFMLFSTVSAAMRKNTWEAFPFDDDIIIAEDQQWAKRVLTDGMKIIYEPASQVRHSHNYTPKELMESKRKIGRASGRFKNKFTALLMGFLLMKAGIAVKTSGDIFFILFKQKNLSFSRKLKEIKISLISRCASFWGRYKGWLEQ